jgi:hypothetical protein
VIDLDSAPDSKIAEGGLHQKYKGPPAWESLCCC